MISTVLSLAKEDEERRKAVLEVIQETKLIDHIHRDCLFYHAGGRAASKNKEKKTKNRLRQAQMKMTQRQQARDATQTTPGKLPTAS